MHSRQIKLTLSLILSAFLLTFAAPSMAYCGQLAFSLGSEEGHTCTLVSSNIIHGILSEGTSIPPTINNIPQGFKIEQAWGYGPNIQLTYLCDQQKIIVLSAHQKYCVAKAGQITTHTSSPETTTIVTKGDWVQGAHGSISWVVR